MTGSDKRTKQ
ncbi:hypothetical protein E2C01_032853 [Portunus trituberculatus]|uniref:Uncharacterized protein n=1 Tax=Portunus trituberculatus TaxID=210409 RepID=A0A5B7EX00_PORTR|nr:hypothetical protein [Portunus trituberculatus]